MKIIENIEVPTGNILIVEGDYGKLECLSIGDYGKDVNIKADFLGQTNTPEKVRHTSLLPLTDKWVVTISSQYSCRMNCNFCDVPKVSKIQPPRNASLNDLIGQVKAGLSLHPNITWSNRLNIHFARMGEPTWNPNVLQAARWLHKLPNFIVHPVVSTMMPKSNHHVENFINEWMYIKNEVYDGNAGLQLSINSTCEKERAHMFNDNAMKLENISNIFKGIKPKGRKITLNFAVADYEIDPSVLLKYFDPEYYIVKLTPMHKTASCLDNNITTNGDYTSYYPYEHYEKELTQTGYDTLVFIASREEDEGRITCGNAILSGTRPFVGI